MGQDQGFSKVSREQRKVQADNRKWKYFSDPEYRASRLDMTRRYYRLWQNNTVYHEFLNLGRKIRKKRASIETHERIIARYEKELRKLDREVKRLEAKRAAKKGVRTTG